MPKVNNIIFTFIAVLILVFAIPVYAVPGNLIQNPSFESGVNNWNFIFNTSDIGVYVTNKDSFIENKSVNFSSSIHDIDLGYLYQYVNLPKNRRYLFSFKYKPFNATLGYPGTEGNTFFVEIFNNFLDPPDFDIQCKVNESSYDCTDINQILVDATLNRNVSNSWNELVIGFNTTSFTPNKFAVTFTLITTGATNNNSYVLLDDVELYKFARG